MARSSQTFSKKEKEKKRLKKRQDKLLKKEERKANAVEGKLENMMAYVDDDGNITDTPPDPNKKKKEIDASTIEIGVPKREDEEPTIHVGKVTFFNDSKGYGFIRDLKTQDNLFVHLSGMIEPVGEGDKVTFDIEKGVKGLAAVRVKKYVAEVEKPVEKAPEKPEDKASEDGPEASKPQEDTKANDESKPSDESKPEEKQ